MTTAQYICANELASPDSWPPEVEDLDALMVHDLHRLTHASASPTCDWLAGMIACALAHRLVPTRINVERRPWYRVHYNVPAVILETAFLELAIDKAQGSFRRQGPTDARPVSVTLVQTIGVGEFPDAHETPVGHFGSSGWEPQEGSGRDDR